MDPTRLLRLTNLVLTNCLAALLSADPGVAQRTPRLVKDIVPGGTSSSPTELFAAGDRLYFRACEPATGCEPWTSDGTSAGTNGNEIWSSDGTAGGTAMAANLATGSGSSAPDGLHVVGDQLFFAATAAGVGRELHVAATGGVSLVRNIAAGATGTNPSRFATLGDRLFFSASDGVDGREAWVSDGTEGGTAMIADIRDGSAASNPDFPVAIGDEVYFIANDGLIGPELWRTDGTEVGTVLVRDLFPGTGTGSNDARRIAWQGELYFKGHDGGADLGDNELWKSDGSETGAVLVRDIRPTSGSGPGEFAAGPDLLFFVANDGGGEVHPWLTDGTAAGTKKAEIPGVAFDPGPSELVRLGDRILFSANDWSVYGRELWAIDHPFFADGFDLGTTTAWSAIVP